MIKMMLVCFIAGIVAFSCQTVEKPQEPECFLNKEEMLTLLLDVATVKSGKDFDLKKIKEKGIVPSDFIYKKNGIDSTIFKDNNAWYAANPKIYQELFTTVRDTLTVKKQRLEQQIAIEDSLKFIQDSIAGKPEKRVPLGMRNRTAQKVQQK